jgi:diguanylate cyclase (GGDEF)-like protein
VIGVGDRDVTDMHYLDLFAERDAEAAGAGFAERVLPVLARGEGWSGEVALRRGDGSAIQVWQALTPVLDHDGRPTRISALGRDVTARRILEQELAHQATHDSLTGLPNRSRLLELLEDVLDHDTAPTGVDEPAAVAVLFLDLDRFKQVNDTLGHEAGDELLSEVARRITAVLRPGDTVARLGGDEFVLLCPQVAGEAQARNLAQRVVAAVESRPIELGASRVRVTVSVGIALSGGGGHPEALLRDADAAMYRAKELGRARLEVFDDALRSRSTERARRADELAVGIEGGEITVVYQPAVDLTTGAVVAVEALARWDHPRLGLLAPVEFITLAEETGLIVGLGLRVLTQACAEARRWTDEHGEGPDVHVNLSARQLATRSLPQLVESVLANTGLPARRLCLEMTESVLMDDAAGAVGTLEALADIGVRLAIDDFGTGYSSLAYLRRFPVDVLKVDRSFVEELGPDTDATTLVAAIVNLATTLGLDAIAEGVETVEQRDALRALGYRSAQGYLFARPVGPDEMAAMVGRRWPV